MDELICDLISCTETGPAKAEPSEVAWVTNKSASGDGPVSPGHFDDEVESPLRYKMQGFGSTDSPAQPLCEVWVSLSKHCQVGRRVCATLHLRDALSE